MADSNQIALHDKIERKIDDLKKRQEQLEDSLDMEGIGPGQVETLLSSWLDAEKEIIVLTQIQAKYR